MTYPNRYLRRSNFTRDKANGRTFDPSKLDPEFNDIGLAMQQMNDRLRGITNADGTLKDLTPQPAMDLLELNRFVATDGQTAFPMSAYDEVNDVVLAFSGTGLIDTASVTKTDSTTVTLPAQATGAVVTIAIFTAGSGTLARLADGSTADEGASLVAVRDAAGLFDATEVETALEEVMTAVNDLLDDIGSVAGLIRADGTVDFAADQSMGGFKITNAAAGSADGEVVVYEQLQAYVNALNAIVNTYLATAGGTMTGGIDMSGNDIAGLPATPQTEASAASKTYVDAQIVAASSAYQDSTGTIKMHLAVPTGWFECDGTEKLTATYPVLAALCASFARGDETAGNFRLPDFSGRVPMGIGTGLSDQVTDLTLDSGGSAYATAPTVTLAGGGGSGATAVCTVSAGVVVTLRLVTRGSGYTSDPTVVFTGGGGTGAAGTATRALTDRALGDALGEESHIQTSDELYPHTHTVTSNSNTGGANGKPLRDGSDNASTPSTSSTGGGEAFNVMQPSLGVRFIIKHD
jgi:microcystin-dependent protein